jgi:organic hydroperoxide reductase OsmC/OhrA
MSAGDTHRYPVSVHWEGGRLTSAEAAGGKPELEVATPPEFNGGIPGVWSPEDLLVAAAASCLAVTLVSAAEARGVPLLALDVAGIGYLGKRDGRLGFTSVELEVTAATEEGRERDLERAVHAAERGCMVARALETPVHVACTISTESLVS